jgi:hypothetical protein
MSVSFGCHCEERKKPVNKRNWRVTKRHYHNSAFNGYRSTYSDYSSVVCLTCCAVGRTKADFVYHLKDVKPGEGGY